MKDSESHDPARKQGSGVAPPPPEKSHDATGSQGVPDTTPPPLEKSRRRRITEISACVVGFLSILFIITVGEWHRGMASSSEPSLGGSELAGDTAGLRVLIWTDRGSATGAETVRLWVLCDNRTGAEVRNLHFLTFETPAFEKTGDPCWKDAAPGCSLEGPLGAGTPKGMPDPLPDGRAAAVFASVRPRFFLGPQVAHGVLAWKDAQGHDFHRSVSLPKGEAYSGLLDWISGSSKAIEIVALPVVLALLGVLLKKQDDDRKKREDDARTLSDNVRKERQEREIVLQQTWIQELPRAMQYATLYYMPAVVKMSKTVERIEDLKTDSSEVHLRRCLYSLLLLLKHMSHLSENIGGLYFKNIEGEVIAGDCWHQFLKSHRNQLGPALEDEIRVLDAITPGMSLAEFTDALKDDTKLGKPVFESLGRLTAWLTESTVKDGKLVKDGELFRDLVFLKLLQNILNFEMNRPLEYWYGHLPQFPGATSKRQQTNSRTENSRCC